MVKCYRLPILLDMASLALVAVISFMAFFLINFAVASGTGQLQLFPGRCTGYTIFVASLAFRVLVLALKGILGILVMVKTGRFPVLVIVAALTFLAQATLMAFLLIVLAMARHAFRRQFLFIQVSLGRQMAVVAPHWLMFAT